MRRIALVSGLVLVGGPLGPSTAFADEEDEQDKDQVRWIAVEDIFTVVRPDGPTFTGDPGQEPTGFPPVGTQLFISEVLYAMADGTTPGEEVGRGHIECTAQAVEGTSCVMPPSCSTPIRNCTSLSTSTSARPDPRRWRSRWPAGPGNGSAPPVR